MPNRLKEGNCFSRLFFWYSLKLFKTGTRKVFDVDDLYQLDPEFTYSENLQNFQDYLQTIPQSRPLIWKLVGFQKTSLLLCALAEFLSKGILIVVPYILKEIISRLQTASANSDGEAGSYRV